MRVLDLMRKFFTPSFTTKDVKSDWRHEMNYYFWNKRIKEGRDPVSGLHWEDIVSNIDNKSTRDVVIGVVEKMKLDRSKNPNA